MSWAHSFENRNYGFIFFFSNSKVLVLSIFSDARLYFLLIDDLIHLILFRLLVLKQFQSYARWLAIERLEAYFSFLLCWVLVCVFVYLCLFKHILSWNDKLVVTIMHVQPCCVFLHHISLIQTNKQTNQQNERFQFYW